MKKIKWLSILFFLFIDCQKDPSKTSTSTGQNGPSIVGQWEWFMSSGALSLQITPQSSGLSWGMKFNSDSTYLQTGTRFTTGTGIYSLGGFPLSLPLYPGQHAIKLSIALAPVLPYYVYSFRSTDTLLLYDFAVATGQDGAAHGFVRK